MPKLRFRLVAVSVVLAGMFALPRPALACTCGLQYEPQESFARSDAVFVGRVAWISDFTWLNQLEYFAAAPPELYPALYRRASLVVSQTWKGSSAAEVVVRTCGFRFATGKDYLVYAHQGRDGLETDVCTRTKEIALAGPDLSYLQSRRQLPLQRRPSAWSLCCAGSAVLVLGLGASAFWAQKRSQPGAPSK